MIGNNSAKVTTLELRETTFHTGYACSALVVDVAWLHVKSPLQAPDFVQAVFARVRGFCCNLSLEIA